MAHPIAPPGRPRQRGRLRPAVRQANSGSQGCRVLQRHGSLFSALIDGLTPPATWYFGFENSPPEADAVTPRSDPASPPIGLPLLLRCRMSALVVGGVMLDQWVIGDANRVCPEARGSCDRSC